MRIRYALQGRMCEADVSGGARFVLALVPPLFHWPRRIPYMLVTVTREYKPVHHDPATDTWTCVGSAEYWQ